jgi:phage FluMu protein Com
MPDLTFQCQVCQTLLSADQAQVGTLVRCPLCRATLRVPAPTQIEPPTARVGAFAGAQIAPVGSPDSTAAAQPAPAPRPPIQSRVTVPSHLLPPRSSSGKRYGFNCGYCSSRLEASEGMAGQEGQCPTCGNTIVIPILDRYGRLIDPMTGKIIKQDPHPVHAYAAAGDRAPGIFRQGDGSQLIQCPRCKSMSPITANNCKSCGMPFTMEGTTVEAAGASNGFCVASLVLGIIGLPASCMVIPPVLAIIFGIIGYNQVVASGAHNAGKGMAIAGIICGAIGSMLALMVFLR